MAKKVILVDDLDGNEAAETIRFGLDGEDFEIDLSEEHAASLRDALALWVAHAHRAEDVAGSSRRTTRSATPSSAPRSGYAPIDRDQATAIRNWARAQGHDVSDRGRIPARIIDLYNESH